MKHIIIFSLLLIAASGRSQETLAFYCDVMANAYEGENRELAANKFVAMFEKQLAEPNSFEKSYSELKWVSIKYDSIKSFRIMTWQLKNKHNVSSYFGFIQLKDGSVFKLMDKSNPNGDSEYEINHENDWIGALYYNLKEVEVGGKQHYILFGFDGADGVTNYKICDVLTFDGSGKPEFGSELFLIKDGQRPDLKTRIVLQYSSIANVNFNFNEGMNMIVHDYIISRAGISPNEPISRIPDGSYSGYQWDGKYWKFIEKIAHQISDSNEIFYQPKPKEIEKKDIFGKKKN